MSKHDKPVVLVIDDNDATVTLVTALLQRDFAVEVATDGNEAVEKLRTRQYACILLDLRMPNLDGFDVLESLKTSSPETLRRVLVLTAALSPGELGRAGGYPICGIVKKPFEIEELLGAVKSCVGRSDGSPLGSVLYSSTVILLLADLIRGKLL